MRLSRSFVVRSMLGRIAAMNTKFQFNLLDLPNELIVLVFEQLDDQKTIRNLCRTCRRVQELAEPILYRAALMRSGYAMDRYFDSLEKKKSRMHAVHGLDLALDPDYAQSFPLISRILCATKNLKRLFIESPQCNSTDFEDDESWEHMARWLLNPFSYNPSTEGARSLQNLQELTMHLNGADSPYWDIDERSLGIFMLPSLTYLKVSCVNISDETVDAVQSVSQDRFTPLKTLELEEANITHKGLQALLSLPKALETLYLGENVSNIQHFTEAIHSDANHLFQRNPGAALEALSLHSQTLQKLTIVTTEKYFQWGQFSQRFDGASDRSSFYGGFADFHALESVTLIGDCAAIERALISSRSPPNLKELTFKSSIIFRRPVAKPLEDQDEDIMSILPFLRAPSSSVPKSLKSLDLVYNDPTMPPMIDTEAAKNFIKAAAKLTEKMGIQLKIWATEPNSYYPPYLYEEPVPKEDLVFNGTDFDLEYLASIERSNSYRLWSLVED